MGVIIGDQPARLHRGGGEALHLVGLAHHMVSLGEGGIEVASPVHGPQRHVAAQVGMDDHCTRLQGLVGVRQSRQDLIVHHDLFQGIGGAVRVLRDEDRHGLADVTDLVQRQKGVPGRAEFIGARVGPGGNLHGQVLDVGRREDCDHAGHSAGGADVDGADISVGVEATEHHGAQKAGELHIVHVRALTGEQPMVFKPSDGLANVGHDRAS